MLNSDLITVRLFAHKDIPLKPGDYVEGAGKHWAEPDIEDAARAMRA
jgi:hypothetical protein